MYKRQLKIIPPLSILLEKVGTIPNQQIAEQQITITDKDSSDGKNSDESKTDSIKNNKSFSARTDGNAIDEKKKRKRGTRGGKKNKRQVSGLEEEEDTMLEVKEFETEGNLKHLTLSNKILGYGSSGTVVFQGKFQNRPVAIKRLLIDFYDIASKEIQLLSESDDHPNVIRYYFSESTEKFLYIAVELCSASLEDMIEKTKDSKKLMFLQKNMDPIYILFQIVSGLSLIHI